MMVAFVVLAIAAASVALTLRTRGSAAPWVVVGAMAFVAVAYPRTLRREEWVRFGDIVAGRPNALYRENRPNRPAVLYRQDGYGFRGAGFATEKPPGVRRVVVVGDSYVFGVGVEENDSLPVALRDELFRRDPARPIEVLDLGVPGDNLASHLDVISAAARLSPDLVVLGLTLPNDLSRWDVQTARRDAQRISAFSFGRFLFGDAAGPFWDLARLERAITPAGLSHLDAQLARLVSLRDAMRPPPAIVVFAFGEMPAAVRSRLARYPALHVVPEFEFWPEDFLHGDGHPSASGNHRFAARIADVVEPILDASSR
jgi:lysophospholipase L1-like esterase